MRYTHQRDQVAVIIKTVGQVVAVVEAREIVLTIVTVRVEVGVAVAVQQRRNLHQVGLFDLYNLIIYTGSSVDCFAFLAKHQRGLCNHQFSASTKGLTEDRCLKFDGLKPLNHGSVFIGFYKKQFFSLLIKL